MRVTVFPGRADSIGQVLEIIQTRSIIPPAAVEIRKTRPKIEASGVLRLRRRVLASFDALYTYVLNVGRTLSSTREAQARTRRGVALCSTPYVYVRDTRGTCS